MVPPLPDQTHSCQRQPYGTRCLTWLGKRGSGGTGQQKPPTEFGGGREAAPIVPFAAHARPGQPRRTDTTPSMLNQQIDYASLVEKALLRVVHAVLGMVAEHGLPGRHHLYITFRTDHPGVVMDDTLRARYPNEMTIVLQHEFWGLAVFDDHFTVTLSFSGLPQRLEIPIDAVTVFADPSVEFGLQFTRTAAPVDQTSTLEPVAKLPAATEKPKKP